MNVESRLGVISTYQDERVRVALLKAFNASKEVNISEIDTLVGLVHSRVCEYGEDNDYRRADGSLDPVPTKVISDITEECLMAYGYYDVAREYISYRRNKDLNRREPDIRALSDFIVASKYARPGETWQQLVDRCLSTYSTDLPGYGHYINSVRQMLYNRQIVGSMRSLQYGGSALLSKHMRMYNCTGTLVNRPKVFSEILWALLCGCGVGWNIMSVHVSKLPVVTKINRKNIVHHHVSDTIEGWADALDAMIQAYMVTGDYIIYDYSLIRGSDSIISSSGAFAPGPLPLLTALENIRSLLDQTVGRQLKPIECHDIICMSADAVLAGGVRRSAGISVFDSTDIEMMYCKAGWGWRESAPWRANANNSVGLVFGVATPDDMNKIIQLSSLYGEPGYYWLDNPNQVPNPCGEILLEPPVDGFDICNLTEINAGTLNLTAAEFISRCEAAAILGVWQTLTCNQFGYLSQSTSDLIKTRPSLGVSITGVYNNLGLFNSKLLNTGRGTVRATAEGLLKQSRTGFRELRRCTCIKPSGTAALALSVNNLIPSGIHPDHDKRYFRRVTLDDNPADNLFRLVNPHMIDVAYAGGKGCITFPIVSVCEHYVKDVTCWDHMALIRMFMLEWADQSVSATVCLDEGIGPDELSEYLYMSMPHRGGLTFIPKSFDKLVGAPRESVVSIDDGIVFGNLIRDYRPVDYTVLQSTGGAQQGRAAFGSACEGTKCSL